MNAFFPSCGISLERTVHSSFVMPFPGCLFLFIPLNKRIKEKHTMCTSAGADSGIRAVGGFAGCCALSDLPRVDFASLLDSAALLSGFYQRKQCQSKTPCTSATACG